MKKKQFVAVVLDPNNQIFVVHVTFLASSNVYSFCKAQIISLKTDKTLTAILSKYVNVGDIFFPNLTIQLPKHTGINNYVINLMNNQLLLYQPIYNLKLVKLKTLKTYIKMNLANNFIRPSKSPMDTPILIIQKLDSSFQLCINY